MQIFPSVHYKSVAYLGSLSNQTAEAVAMKNSNISIEVCTKTPSVKFEFKINDP